jgi:hypothetical protein
MLSDWYITVAGDATHLGLVEDLLQGSTEHTLAPDEASGEWRLRSARLGGISEHEVAWERVDSSGGPAAKLPAPHPIVLAWPRY